MSGKQSSNQSDHLNRSSHSDFVSLVVVHHKMCEYNVFRHIESANERPLLLCVTTSRVEVESHGGGRVRTGTLRRSGPTLSL